MTTGLSCSSRTAHRSLPGRRLSSSEELGWPSILVEVVDQPAVAEEFTTATTPDLLVVMGLQGQFQLESRNDGRWRSEVYRRGTIGVTGPGNADVLRWRGADSHARRTLHVHIASGALEETRAELAHRGRPGDLDVLDLADPAASSILTALHTALRCQSDAMVAESLGQALMVQVLSAHRPVARATRPSPSLSSATLARVLDFIEAHVHERLTLDDLAREANTSKFHFLRAFAGTLGNTPHRYVAQVRMTRAEELLGSDELTVSTIASMCGYSSTGRFTAAFRERYGVTPGAYRRR